MAKKEVQKGEIIIYRSSTGPEIQVKLEKETVWLDAHLIARLFDVNRPAIVKHINNVYGSGELNEISTCSKMEQVAADGKIRKMNLYNLDVIISVGYRVNSQRATQFRIWANKVLKQYLVKGYAVNEKRLLEAKTKFKELQETVSFLQRQSKKERLVDQGTEILNLLADYSKTLSLLDQYDKKKIHEKRGTRTKFKITYNVCTRIITELKRELVAKKEAGSLFGQENGRKLETVISGLYQTFARKELYPTIEDKAAHVLYLINKDHVFVDGNKRISSFLFVYFLDKSNHLFKKSGERKINDNALVALTLLVAESDPKDKGVIVKIIKNLITG